MNNAKNKSITIIKVIEFFIIIMFALTIFILPNRETRKYSFVFLAVLFGAIFIESILKEEANIKFLSIKKSENRKLYYAILLFQLVIALISMACFVSIQFRWRF